MKASMSRSQSDDQKKRKLYIKPRVSRVNLVSKDVVLASGCKTNSPGIESGFNALLEGCTLGSPCSAYGS